MNTRGIDVSAWQGNIDFEKVKNAGYDFVIIRAGYGKKSVDRYWESNYQKAKAAGLSVGAYWYSYATSADGARNEARSFIKALAGKQLDFPVYMDLEEKSQISKGMDFCSSLVQTFCDEMEKAGFYAGFYTSTSYARNVITSIIGHRYTFWAAEWGAACHADFPYGIWQYSSKGKVPGIVGNVDLDIGVEDFPSIIKDGGYNGYRKATSEPEATKTDLLIALEVLNGLWGNGEERRRNLEDAGYDYEDIQARVDELLQPKPVYHVVQRGETLSGIAERYGTSARAIQKLNPGLIKNVNRIKTGWKIRVK